MLALRGHPPLRYGPSGDLALAGNPPLRYGLWGLAYGNPPLRSGLWGEPITALPSQPSVRPCLRQSSFGGLWGNPVPVEPAQPSVRPGLDSSSARSFGLAEAKSLRPPSLALGPSGRPVTTRGLHPPIIHQFLWQTPPRRKLLVVPNHRIVCLDLRTLGPGQDSRFARSSGLAVAKSFWPSSATLRTLGPCLRQSSNQNRQFLW